ncbi:MAG: tRNA uracil 4-sulfurtransferase ThiI, partial [Candidatus Moranbacteria bacterium]|jgi:thiamine biosynthesis protein ThiI|nr:tRNA uracil 4-sulfurtransferase ThiI [Candidatus Moranbacteria bacterium]
MIIICHYDEIALKGKNRDYFEKKLVENIKNKLTKELHFLDSWKVRKMAGRILIEVKNDLEKKLEKFLILREVFGIVNFSFAQEASQDLNELKKICWQLLEKEKFDNFRISASRSDKNFSLSSMEINKEVGSFIVEKTGAQVKLKDAQVEVFIEITNKRAFIYKDKIQGAGGLPVGSGGKVLALLSGGIDSPVAAYYILKRGARADFIHFHSLPYTSVASNEKVIELAVQLSKFQGKSKVFMIPFAKIQEQIVINCPEKLRVVLYRRLMMKIAQEVAQKNKCLALVTGEVLSQVASQTLENIFVTNNSVALPIFRPLIGLDKIEIMRKAQEIGTYKTSILPHEDCCTRFVPKHPETKADLGEVKLAEGKLNVEELIKEAVKGAEIKIIN